MTLLFNDFYKSLEDQYLYLADGGTSYRQKTALLALDIAKYVKQVDPFLDHEGTKKLVRQYLQGEDNYRVLDVSKMLYHNAKEQKFKEAMSPELEERIAKRRTQGKYKLF